MTGSIQVKNGYLYAVIQYKDEAEKKKYKWISTGLKERGNRKAAKEILEKELAAFEENQRNALAKLERRGKPKEIDKSAATMLFSDYCDEYLESIKSTLSPEVYDTYKYCYIKLFKEYFDAKKLRLIDITEDELNDFYKYRKENGVKNVTLKHYNCILRPALRKAFKDKLIPDNPFDFLEPIKKEKHQISYFDRNEMKALFEAIRGHKLEVPFLLAAYYGFRRSEVLGLRWSAIDFDHKLITINHKLLVVRKQVLFMDELKTASSNRTLPLIPAIEKLLLKHREQIDENKKFYGNTYDTRYLDYVCVHENGKIIYPDHMSKKFSDLLKEKNLKHIRLHDLRHSCASNMLANGVQMKEIQEWLGHSNFSTTADVYSHLDFSAKVKAANTIASAYEENSSQIIESKNTDILSIILSDMRQLGINSLEDYLTLKQKEIEIMQNSEKEDFQM